MTKEVLKLALEALEYHTVQTRPIHQTNIAITAIKEALAQQSGWRKVQIDDAEEEAWKEMEKKNKAAFKSWFAWYTSLPENWNEKYGDAFVWTAQEKALMQQLKGSK